MIRAGLLFPGQGAQYVGMGADLYRGSAVFRHAFDGVCQAAGMDLGDVCFRGTRIDETALTQPAIYAVSVSTLAVLLDMGVVPERCAGLSLGEYGALACAGVFDLFAGAKLVKRRGELMGALDGTGGLAAVAGLTGDEVEALRARHFEGRRLYIANHNLPTQLVVGGEPALLESFCRLALERGAKIAKPLRTSGPFHTPMMRTAGEALGRELAAVSFEDPRCEVYANVLGAPYRAGADAAGLLARQVSEPVRWLDCLDGMLRSDLLIEVGPGAVLTGMVRRLDRRKRCVTVGTVEEAAALGDMLGRKDDR